MSHFSAALQRALDDLSWSQQELIAATGIHRTSMSGYVRGSTPVGPRTLRKIAGALPEDRRAPVARAWLLDQLPKEFHPVVDIRAHAEAVREEDPQPFADCPDQVRQGLELLARKSVHPAVRDLIVDLAKLLGGETTSS